MDKTIIDKLIKFGLITNVGINADNYQDVDDLIKKGIITVPGAKDRIIKLFADESNSVIDNKEIIVEEKIIKTEEVTDIKQPIIEETKDEHIIEEQKTNDEVKILENNKVEDKTEDKVEDKTETKIIETKKSKKQNKITE